MFPNWQSASFLGHRNCLEKRGSTLAGRNTILNTPCPVPLCPTYSEQSRRKDSRGTICAIPIKKIQLIAIPRTVFWAILSHF